MSGRWAGDQASLTFDDGGDGAVVMGCATATFEGPVTVDVGGHWLREGRYFQGTGVALRDPPAGVPAMISGRLDRDGTLWLSIATAEGLRLDNNRLFRNREPTFPLCL